MSICINCGWKHINCGCDKPNMTEKLTIDEATHLIKQHADDWSNGTCNWNNDFIKRILKNQSQHIL